MKDSIITGCAVDIRIQDDIAGLRVEVWDKNLIILDLVGVRWASIYADQRAPVGRKTDAPCGILARVTSAKICTITPARLPTPSAGTCAITDQENEHVALQTEERQRI